MFHVERPLIARDDQKHCHSGRLRHGEQNEDRKSSNLTELLLSGL